MGHTLVLEVPEEVYEPLAKRAEQLGSTPWADEHDTYVGRSLDNRPTLRSR